MMLANGIDIYEKPLINCTSGLVVEYIVAIDVTRVDSRLVHLLVYLCISLSPSLSLSLSLSLSYEAREI